MKLIKGKILPPWVFEEEDKTLEFKIWRANPMSEGQPDDEFCRKLNLTETYYRSYLLERMTKKKIVEIIEKYELGKDIACLFPTFRKQKLHYTKYRKDELINMMTQSFIVGKLKEIKELKNKRLENKYRILDDTWVYTGENKPF